MNKIDILRNLIDNSKYLVFFGGAGVSTASNIPDFRSSNGIYSEKFGNLSIERIISHSFFNADPATFFKLYKEKLVFEDALPNKCHIGLAHLEDKGILKAVITQNIDNLHQLAGSKNVIELHGSVYRNYCMNCHKFYTLHECINQEDIPRCSCGGIIKPDVVLYEEPLNEETVMKAISEISKADTLIIGGTSLVVYPAAYYINYFRGKNLIILNKGSLDIDKNATLVINDDISKVFEELGY